MSSDIERWQPPNDAAAFESLCLDLWKDIWQDSGAQKNGRRGQTQAGVDIFGRDQGQLIGIQCKQKDGRLRSTLTVTELETEVKAALEFDPPLAKFILATTATRNVALQRRANELTAQNSQEDLFVVEVWAWEDIWHELYRRYELFSRIAHIYWPFQASLPPPPPSLEDLVLASRPYLEYIAPQCQRLPLIGLDPKAKDTLLTLDAVYTALSIKSSECAGSALQAAATHPCLVLKGDPGSGKSTFTSYLSLCLAKHHLEPEGRWLQRLVGWPANARYIPMTIVLRDFVRVLPKPLPEPCPRRFWDFFLKILADAQLSTCGPALEDALNLGHAIVFLDGLDEIPTDDQRGYVRACTLKFAERFRHSRLVLTCRTIPYAAMLQKEAEELKAHPGPILGLADVPVFELAPFDDKQIDAFITGWYMAHVPKPFSHEVAEERRNALAQAVQRPELQRLAGNPMLLTDMALLHTHRGHLPDDRAKLYKEVIDLLLLRWDESRQGSRLQDLLREAKRDDNDLLRTLASVAFAVHSRSRNLQPDETGEIQHHELLYALRDLHPVKSLDWASRLIDTIKERAGLLIAVQEEVFHFPHRSFQEYLAALHFIKDRITWDNPLALLDETGYWREVIKWAAGRIAHVDDGVDEKGLNLLRRLCPSDSPPFPLPWHRVWLAGEVLLEMSLAKVEQFTSEGGPELVTRIRSLLKQLLEQGALSPFERAQAATALAPLGDDRPGVDLRPDGFPDIDWIEIPAGPFVMGGEHWCGAEREFTCDLIRQPYRISRYPVTVAQFEAFVQAGGYSEPRFWIGDGWELKGDRARPEDYEAAYQTRNHPRVGVNWYEAIAFCRWLSERLQVNVMLPTEEEWERAARHTDGRIYPWGNSDDDIAHRCNMKATGLGHTSPVGVFRSGNAECGAADMAGNVWEWTRSLWATAYGKPEINYPCVSKDGPEIMAAPSNVTRVLRGGAWNYHSESARCACRVNYVPDSRQRHFGFRLTISPFVSSR